MAKFSHNKGNVKCFFCWLILNFVDNYSSVDICFSAVSSWKWDFLAQLFNLVVGSQRNGRDIYVYIVFFAIATEHGALCSAGEVQSFISSGGCFCIEFRVQWGSIAPDYAPREFAEFAELFNSLTRIMNENWMEMESYEFISSS